MKNIIEIKELMIGQNYLYQVTYNDKTSRIVQVTAKQIIVDGETRYLIWDSQSRVITDISLYIEDLKEHCSINTKISILQSMKLLYTYLDIFKKQPEEINYNDIKLLTRFIRGESFTEGKTKAYMITSRKENTVKKITNDISSYFKYLNTDNLKKLGFSVYSIGRRSFNEFGKYRRKSIKNYQNAKAHSVAPIYITPEQYSKILEGINTLSKTYLQALRNKLIIEIMYKAGARIGEVFGITLEDIELAEGISSKTGEVYKYGIIKLRNRQSDKKTQKAKTVPESKRAYNPNDKDLYEEIYISESLFNELCEYIALSTEQAYVFENGKTSKYITQRKRRKSSYDKARADAIADYRKKGIDNYYIFLSRYFTPISDHSWNKQLKKLFEYANIEFDKGKKVNGLNHRFRHGFAMNLVHAGCKIEDLQRLMRHGCIQSTLVYYNPTREELINKKMEFEKYTGIFLDEENE